MSFIRVKNIGKKNGKKYRYAYLVENKWRKRIKGGRKGSRQKVSKYLGKVVRLEKVKEMGFFEFINIKENAAYLENNKAKIVEDLVKHELSLRGFAEKEGVMEREGLRFDIAHNRFVNNSDEEEKIVIEMNEGFLCRHTLNALINFRSKKEDEREKGIELANAFLETGLNVPKEIFVGYFEKV